MSGRSIPHAFDFLLSHACIDEIDIIKTSDGFSMVNRSIADLLFVKGVMDCPDGNGGRIVCSRFFDDWYLYAVPHEEEYVYSLLKLREQEHDAEDGTPADGDTPGVTISFISFQVDVLLSCLSSPTEENRKILNNEINRVVAYYGQRHHKALKRYFSSPQTLGAYLVAKLYVKHIASLAEAGRLAVPERYKEIVQQSISYKFASKLARLPRFIDALNRAAGRVVCDNEYLYFENQESLNECEVAAVLATHTGNTSVYSFAAEVEFHARFLTPLAKFKIPFYGRSVYESAIRADMSVNISVFESQAPFYQPDSRIVKRQYMLHSGQEDTRRNTE